MTESSSTVVAVTPEREAAALDLVNNISTRKWDDPGDAAFAQAEIALQILKSLHRIEDQLQFIVERDQPSAATRNGRESR